MNEEIWLVYLCHGAFSKDYIGDYFPGFRVALVFSTREKAWDFIRTNQLTPSPFSAGIEVDSIESYNNDLVEYINYRHLTQNGTKIPHYIVVHSSKINDGSI
jgi:hypothetical protein